MRFSTQVKRCSGAAFSTIGVLFRSWHKNEKSAARSRFLFQRGLHGSIGHAAAILVPLL